MGRYMRTRKANGQFKRTTLADFGFRDSDLNKTERHCGGCGKRVFPILLTYNCECGHANDFSEKTAKDSGGNTEK